jgi:GNAT superfamily N-acetyltransferase
MDSYWAELFDCAPSALRGAQAHLSSPRGVGDFPECYLMEFGGAPVVSLPADERDEFGSALLRWTAGIVRDPARAASVFGSRVEEVSGPAFVGYTTRSEFQPHLSTTARLLTPADNAAVDALRAECTSDEWDHGGSEAALGDAVGSFEGSTLAALAGHEPWGPRIAHIAVVTHPALRGRGHAAAAVSALTALVLSRGLIPQYRTLEDNGPSLSVARSLGYEAYATSMAIRLSVI